MPPNFKFDPSIFDALTPEQKETIRQHEEMHKMLSHRVAPQSIGGSTILTDPGTWQPYTYPTPKMYQIVNRVLAKVAASDLSGIPAVDTIVNDLIVKEWRAQQNEPVAIKRIAFCRQCKYTNPYREHSDDYLCYKCTKGL